MAPKIQKTALLALVLGLGVVSGWNSGWFAGSQESSQNETVGLATAQASSHSHLQAKTKTKTAQRTTKLGKAQPVKNNKHGEQGLLMLDPAMSKKWGLKLTEASLAWEKHHAWGSRKVVVAIIDTGIDANHPDLRDNLWVNKGEVGIDKYGHDKATNHIDDDHNGFVDDVHGWNFVGNNNDLTDHHGHGTHIAGIIGAVGGNGIGVSGVSPRVSLMILKYYDPNATGSNNLYNTVRAIRYATKMGAQIINYSGGGLEKSAAEYAAIKAARKKGILYVAAAGNERSDSDVHGYYPADYDLDNIISVTAINPEKTVLPSSNYGIHSVDVAAPGYHIYSTLPGGQYGYMTGTSQATAFVTGVAALIKAKFPDFDYQRIKQHITQTGDLDQRLAGKTRYRKRLNAYRALAYQDAGVNVNGSVADNASNLNPIHFVSDPSAFEENRPLSLSPTNTGSLAMIIKTTRKILAHSQQREQASLNAFQNKLGRQR